MTGLFSLVDALLDNSMDNLLAKLPLSKEVTDALLGKKCLLFNQLELVKAYEAGSWYAISKLSNVVGISQDELPSMFKNATQWSETYENCSATN